MLSETPLCTMCMVAEVIEPATVVDHVKPHRGDEALFWDRANLQPLCKYHHDSTKKRMELGQDVILFGPDGWPI